MKNSNTQEICVLSIIFKHPKTGEYASVVECGNRQIFENSIKALESKKVEVIFKHCESESELFSQGLTLHEGFTGADFILRINTARINEEASRDVAKAKDKDHVASRVVSMPKKMSYQVRKKYPPAIAL